MSDLKYQEKVKLEKLLGMGSGWVLDFVDRSFREFVQDSVAINIDDDRYSYQSGSKANRLRAFWSKESNYLVGTLLIDLLDHRRSLENDSFPRISGEEETLFNECSAIANRLKETNSVDNIEAIESVSDEKTIQLITSAIRESLRKNEPEAALDRLHTFTTKFLRELSDKYSIKFTRDTPLHSLIGGYVKNLRDTGKIETLMTERILSGSVQVLDAYNKVRNNHSLAHPNPILNYNESRLIIDNVLSLVRFIKLMESMDEDIEVEFPDSQIEDDIPF